MRKGCHFYYEFALLSTNLPFYEVKRFSEKGFAQGEISKYFSRPSFTIIFGPKMLILYTFADFEHLYLFHGLFLHAFLKNTSYEKQHYKHYI